MKCKKAKTGGILFLIFFSSFFATFMGLISSDPNKEKIDDSIDLGTSATWLTPVEISQGSDRDTRYSEIAVGRDGTIHFVWEDYSNRFDSDYNWDIFYRRWDATTASFTATFDLSSASTSDAYFPAVAVDSEGNAHIVWHDYTNVYGATGSDYDIFYRMWNKSTGTLSGHINTYDCVTSGMNHSSSCYYPDVAADPQGNVHVVWADPSSILESDGAYDIYYKCWNATTGNWGPLALVSSESISTATYPSIATDSLSNVHVAWQDQSDYFNESENNYDVFYKYWNSTTGTWSSTEMVSSESTNAAQEPSITVDGLGNVHAAWHDTTNIYGAGTDYDIFYRMRNATTQVWSGHSNSTDLVSQRSGSYASQYASIGADASGNAYVAWEEYYFDGYSYDDAIHRMWNISSGLWETMVKVSTSQSYDDAWRPAIAVDAGGSSYVTWLQEESWDEIWFSKSIGSAPLAPILDPIVPNPNPNLDNILTWTRPMEPAQFYVFRNSSYISSVDGLTPIAVVSKNSYADVVTANGTYYYAVIAENEIGNSTLSNCEGVNVSSVYGFHRLRIAQNADFPKYNFTGNGTESNPWLIENWYINAFGGNGIHISDTTDYFIAQNNTIFGGNHGIFLRNVINGRLINNTVYSNVNGINLTNSIGNTLINNTVYDNTNPSGTSVGIALTYSDGNWFEDNNVYGNDGAAVYGGLGFWLYTSESNTLLNNHIHHNLGTGVLFTQSSNFNNFTGNQIYSNTGTIGYDQIGIAFENSGGNNNYFIKNNIYDHTAAGMYSSHAGVPNFFFNNTFHDNYVAMDTVISNAAGWQFNFNKFYNNYHAGDLWMGSASFYKNEIWNNTNGISFWGSGGTTMTNNTFWNNTNYGLVAGANDMELYNNIAYDNGAGIYCSDIRLIADGNSAYNNTGVGFYVYYDTQFTNNFASGNDIGVYLGGNGPAYLESNTIVNNREGIHAISAINSTITNNDILNNSQYGIYLENSNHTVITWNTLFNGTEGIYLLDDLNSTVKYNEVYNFSQVGIYIENTNASTISWNLLFNNGKPLEEVSGVNNTIGINPSQLGPVLSPIVPPTVDDGWVHLQWQSLPWATYYQVFRSWVFNIDEFWDIIWATPILNVTTNDVWDTQFSNTGTYYYVVVAANATTWSTISNTESVSITGIHGIPGTPILDPIVPAIDLNSIIDLDWDDVQNATDYYIYRDTSVITDITGLTAVAKVTDSNFTDTVPLDDTYYYVVVGSNTEHNGSISNCENVTVIISPLPETPTLSPIIPSTDYDGFIYLNWTDAGNATYYHVYRDVAPIITLTGLDPIASTLQSNFTDINFVDGVYYYAVTSGNAGWNSSPSNSANVTIDKQYPVGLTIMNPISPSTDTDGIISLTWAAAENASWYYVYKDTAFIVSVASLTPIAAVAGLNFTHYSPINGTFFYAIVGANFLFNATLFSSESVTVAIPARTVTGWTNPSILSPDSKNSSSSPTMAMDAEGNLFVVWADASTLYGSGGDVDIFCRIWNASTQTWGGVMVVSTESTADSTAPAVAIDNLGNFYVAWADATDWNGSGTDGDIFYKIYNVTTEAWSQMVLATTESGSLSSDPGIAVDDSGNVHVVWSEFNGTQTNIYATFWNTTSSSWIGNATVSSEIVGDSQNPQIGVDANYNVHITWEAASSSLSSGADDDIFYRMANISGQYWSGIELVSAQSLLDSNYPTVIVENDGTVHVAWHDLTPYAGSGGDYDIFYKNRDIVTGFWLGFDNSTDVVSSGSDGSSIYPGITIDENSVVHVVWVDYSDLFGAGTDADIFYKFWNSSSLTWQGFINTTDIVTLESSGDAFSASVAVVRNEQGELAKEGHVVWQDQTNFGFGDDWDVYYKSLLDIYPIPETPYLNPITPKIDYDGIIFLDWTVSNNATKYFVYRDVSSITDVGALIPIVTLTTEANYTDILSVGGTYYYVVVAGNQRFNTSLSNCENVTFIQYSPVGTPNLDPITPSVDYDGLVALNWSSAENATVYYVYVDASVITNVNTLTPIITTIDTNEEVQLTDGTYYFVVVAGNPSFNSSLSNCVNVTVNIQYPVTTPILWSITPNPSYDGLINLDWSDATNTTVYYIYRHFTNITNITGLVPIANVTQSTYLDITNDNTTWYYVIVAGNLAYNSSISNCQNVTVTIVPIPETPILNFIFPSTNYYGNVSLDWTDTANTTHYYVYRDTYPLSNITGLTPIVTVWDSNYTDYNFIDGTYSYFIVSANLGRNGSASNIQNVTIEMYYPISTPTLGSIVPNPDYDGIIELDWDDAPNATRYYVYRDSLPLANVTQSNYTDIILTDGTYTYTIIAGNPGYNSSLSNAENVTVNKYWPVGTPILDQIVPNLDYDGYIALNWSSAENATQYYIYRDTVPINTIIGLTPHALVIAQTNYTDVEFTDGTYYYVVVASNFGYNSTISNSRNVTVLKQYPVGFSLIDPISPRTDTDGVVLVTWISAENASFYRLYKDISSISSVSGLEPIATVSSLNFTDYSPINGTFYYAVVPGNPLYIGSVQNSEWVTVAIPARTTTGWTPPEVLSDICVNDSSTPTIALDASGNRFVVWADATDILGAGSDLDIFCRIWNASTGSWESIVVVSTESDSNSTAPAISIDTYGNLHVTWVDVSDWSGAGTDADVFYKLYNASLGTWTQTVVITSASNNASNDPAIAVDTRGGVFIAWWETNGSQTNIYGVFRNATTLVWSENSTVSTEITGDSRYPKIGVDDAYNLHVIWEASSSSLASDADIDIFYRMYDWTRQAWNSTELVSLLLLDSNRPTLTVDGDRNVYAAWHDLAPYASSGPDEDIFFRYRNVNTGTWQGFVGIRDVISTESDAPSLYPSISLDNESNVHVCWIDYSNIQGAGNDADVFYKFFNRTSLTWSGMINQTDIISGESSGDSFAASLIAGSIHVAWQDKTHFGFGNDWDIFYKNLVIFEVEEEEPGPEDGDGSKLWIIIIIAIAAVAAVASLFVLRTRSKSRGADITAPKFNKMAMGEVRSALKEVTLAEDKVVVLQKNNFPIELISELYDGTLTDFFRQTFTTVPIQLIEFLQKLDAPLEQKLEILEEFNNLSDEQKEEFLKELTEF